MTRAALLVCAVFLIAVAALAAGILNANHGVFSFTMDDAYIHLALAENIARGTYGVNLHELSAPSSSIVWPFLLVLLGSGEVGALLLNVAAALGALVLFDRIITWSLPDACAGLRVVLLVLFGLIANLVGLTFIGMEHTLQVFAAVLLVAALIHADRSGDIRWLALAVVVNPLVRYENLILCFAACVYWLLRRDLRRAVLLGVLSVVLPALFPLWLIANGFAPLPTSVIAKSSLSPLANLSQNLHDSSGIFILLTLPTLLIALVRRQESRFVLIALLVGGLFLLFGSPARYAWFAAAALLALTFYVWRLPLRRWLARPFYAVVLLLVTLEFTAAPLILISGVVASSNNVYAQQYQMHRFVTDYWRQPIAVNDLGWVSYRNDGYVLDLYGLASLPALRLRKSSADSSWMPPLMRAQGVSAAMLYASWFPRLSDSLIEVATITLVGPQRTVADPTVHFYALTPDAADQLRAALNDFSRDLPADLSLRFVQPEPDGGTDG